MLLPLEIPTLDPDTPWWAVLLYCTLSALIPVIVILVTRGNSKKEIQSTKDVVDQVKEQVANTHDTNLRVDIDVAKKSALDASLDAKLAKESAHRVEALAADMIRSLRAIEHSADRREGIHEDEARALRLDVKTVKAGLKAHLDDVPRILDEALDRHRTDCPVLVQSPRVTRKG